MKASKQKSELRQDMLNEITGEGKKLYAEKDIKILSENTRVIQLWIKNDPEKAEDFLRFKASMENKKEKSFLNLSA